MHIKVIARKILLSAMHQVQVVEVEVEVELIIRVLQKRSKGRDTAQKRSKSSGQIYLKMRTNKNYSIFQRTYQPDLQL